MLGRLTFTRFFAASIVVFFHYAGASLSGLPDFLQTFLTAGPVAVSYFYTLSGFIMAIVYAKIRPGDARHYWVARLARLYPVYLLGIALCVLLLPFAGRRELWSNLLLVQSWQPGIVMSVNPVNWSLSVEAFFYLLFPGLMILARKLPFRSWASGVAALWLASQVVAHAGFARFYGGYPSPSHDFLFYFPLLHLNSFLVGMSAGILVGKGRIRLGAAQGRLLTAAALAASIWGIAFLPYYSSALGFTILTTNGLLAPVFGLLIVGLYFSPSRLMESKPMQFLGESSYSIYILQVPLFALCTMLVPALGSGDKASFWLYFALLLGASFASFSFLENPARRLIRSAFERIWTRAAVQPGGS